MLRHVLTLVLAGWSSVAAAQCLEATTAAQIHEQAMVAEEALASADSEAYRAAHDSMVSAVPCLGELLPTNIAAALHRTGGVRSFLDRDIERARVRFAVARVLDPGYSWPDGLLPPGHPILSAYLDYPVRGLEFVLPPKPRRGIVAVDGRIGQGRLTGLPATFQLIDNDGTTRQSVLLEPFDTFPSYPSRKRRGVRPSSLVAVASAVGAGVLYGLAWNARNQYDDPDTPYSELDSLRGQTLGFSIGAGVLLGAAAGSAVVAISPRTSR